MAKNDKLCHLLSTSHEHLRWQWLSKDLITCCFLSNIKPTTVSLKTFHFTNISVIVMPVASVLFTMPVNTTQRSLSEKKSSIHRHCWHHSTKMTVYSVLQQNAKLYLRGKKIGCMILIIKNMFLKESSLSLNLSVHTLNIAYFYYSKYPAPPAYSSLCRIRHKCYCVMPVT